MGIERVEAGCDEGWVRECYEIFCAAQAVDDPEGPPMGRAVFEGWMRWGWASDPRETWVLVGGAGRDWRAGTGTGRGLTGSTLLSCLPGTTCTSGT